MDKKGHKELLIIMPAYNEEKNIGKVLEQLEQAGICKYADVLVMNDASSDATNWLVKARGYTLVTHVFNLGYGSALQLGYKYAIRRKYHYVIQMDADGQHDVCNIPILYAKLKEQDANGKCPDIVLGSRFLKGSEVYPTTHTKKFAYRLFRWMIRVVTGESISDPLHKTCRKYSKPNCMPRRIRTSSLRLFLFSFLPLPSAGDPHRPYKT